MLAEILQIWKRCWWALVVADLAFKLAATVVIAPLVAVAFRAFVATSGRDVLADEDILKFVLSPIGIGCLLVVGGLALAALLLEQAVLLRIIWATAAGRTAPLREAAIGAIADTLPTLKLSGLLLASALVLAVPYLAGVAVVYWMLLTGHDINYYLADKPPVFWIAVVMAAGVLLVGGAMLMWWLVARVLSIPILVVRRTSVREAIALSQRISDGGHSEIARWLGGWLAVALFAPPLLLAGFIIAGRSLLQWVDSLPWLVLLTGGLLLVYLLIGLLVSLATVISFALIVWKLWERRDMAGRAVIQHFVAPNRRAEEALLVWNRHRLTAAAVIAVLVAGIVGATSLAGIKVKDNVQIIAHRGGATRAPENSLAAIRLAMQDHAEWIEIDVQETSDGALAVVHDRDLKRIAGEAANVYNTTLQQLQQYDIGKRAGAAFVGERVATLEDVLEATQGKVGVVIELKHYGHNQRLEERVVELVEKLQMADEVIIISLDRASIAKVRQLRPTWRIGLLTAVALGDLTRVDADLLAVNTEIATPAFITRSQLAGRKVAAWTVNDRQTMIRVLSRGVDYVITDDVPLAREVIDEHAKMPLVQRWLTSLAARL